VRGAVGYFFLLPVDGLAGVGEGAGLDFESVPVPPLLTELRAPSPFVPVGRLLGCISIDGVSMSDQPLSVRLEQAPLPVLEEMLREAELHLASQQAVALAADQRALTLTGYLSAAAIVLVGSASSFILAAGLNIALGAICLLVGGALLVAVGLAVRAAAPSDFDFAGSSPADWVVDVETEMSLRSSLAAQCQNHAEAISDNHTRMRRNARLLWLAIKVSFGAVIVGSVAFTVTLAYALAFHAPLPPS
jgi:hypothetical protein